MFIFFGLSMGQRKLCNCSDRFYYVCGSNGITYNNDCLLNCFANSMEGRLLKLEKAYDGPCSTKY